MIGFTDLEVQTIIAKGIQLERDCKALLVGDFNLLYPAFGKYFYRVFGDSGPKLLRDLEHDKNWDASNFILDLSKDNLRKFVFYY